MANHRNHRRNEHSRTEHGPSWENSNPGKGCNSTHVAKSRSDWKKIKNRSFRRTGKVSPKFNGVKKGKLLEPIMSDDEGLLFLPEGLLDEPIVDLGSFLEYIDDD